MLSAAMSPAFWPYTRPGSWGKLGEAMKEFCGTVDGGADGEEAGGSSLASICNQGKAEKNAGSAARARGGHEVSRSEARVSAIRLCSHAPWKLQRAAVELSFRAPKRRLRAVEMGMIL